jgi:hypothetical protein
MVVQACRQSGSGHWRPGSPVIGCLTIESVRFEPFCGLPWRGGVEDAATAVSRLRDLGSLFGTIRLTRSDPGPSSQRLWRPDRPVRKSAGA